MAVITMISVIKLSKIKLYDKERLRHSMKDLIHHYTSTVENKPVDNLMYDFLLKSNPNIYITIHA